MAWGILGTARRYYGRINYGFGYSGVGFYGGRWEGGMFRYNTAVMRVGPGFHGVYEDRTVMNETTVINRASYNGAGGVVARPTADERVAMNEQHVQRTSEQISHHNLSGQDRNLGVGKPWSSASPRGDGRARAPGSPAAARRRGRQFRAIDATGNFSVEHNEAKINKEVHSDRVANGGKLTPSEHREVEHQQNKESHQIYNEKHDARTEEHPHGEGKK